MKIIYFHQYFTTPLGSGGTRSYFIARELVKNGHEVHLICLNDERAETGLSSPFKNGLREGYTDGIKITEINFNYSNHLNIIERSFIFLKYSLISSILALRKDYDLVFASSTPLTAAFPGIIFKLFKGRKFIFEVRDLWPEVPVALGVIKNPLIIFFLKILERVAYLSADKCIGLAPGICSGIQNKGISRKKITMIPNASDNEIFRPLNIKFKKRPDLLPEIGKTLDKNSFVAAFTGAHGIANGLDSLIEVALELKRRKRKDINIILIGEGKCKNKLKKLVKDKNLENFFFLPSISKLRLAELLRKSVHVGLMVLKNMPEFYNGTSPNKFFDYIACGLPIINNYPGWISNIIKEKNIGIAVSPYDYNRFAEALIYLADNKLSYENKSVNARKLAIKDYSSKKLATIVRKLLEELN